MAEQLKNKGNEALQQGRVDEAIKYYSSAIALDPKNHVLYSNRSAAYCKANKYEEALKDAEECVKIKPDWSKGFSRKGGALEFLGRLKEAQEAYEEGLRLEPTNEQLKSSLNNVKAAMDAGPAGPGDMNPNLSDLFSDPKFKEKLENHPKCREHMKDPDFLMKIELIRKNPKLFGSFLNDKRMLDVLGALLNLDSSQFEVRTADGKQPDDEEEEPAPPPKEKKPEPKKTEKMDVDLTDDQRKALAEKEMGNEAYKKKDFQQALIHYDLAIQHDPTSMAYYNNKAAVYFEQKEYQLCVQECEKAVDVGRENRADYSLIAKAYARMAAAFHKLDDLVNAKKFYEKSLSEFRAPDVVKKCQEVTKLLKERERLQYINPELAEKEKNLGNQEFQAGSYPTALKHYSEAILRSPDDAKLYSNRAACYNKLMEFPLALKDCEKAIELDPKFVKAYLRKGSVLLAMKENAKAADAYRQAMRLDPNCAEARNGYTQAVMSGDTDSKSAQERAMNDPEVQEILSDPAMQMILRQMQKEPAAAREHLKNPVIAEKLEKLMAAGIVGMR